MATPVSATKIIGDLHRVESWGKFHKIRDYFQEHAEEYTTVERTEIEDAISQKEQYFDPEDCSLVEGISVSFEDHPNLLNYNREKATGVCEEAKTHNMPLPDWIFAVHTLHGKEPTDFSLKVHRITGYEKSMATEIGLVPGIKPAILKNEPGVLTLEIDRAELLNEIRKLREDFSEESENLRIGLEKRISELTANIHAIQSGKPLPEPEKPYAKTMSYSRGEYSIFTKVMASKTMPPIDVRILGRDKSEIRVQLSGREENVEKVINETKRRYAMIPKRQVHRMEGAIIDKLCGRYTNATGYPCNNSIRELGAKIDALFRGSFGEDYDVQAVEGLLDEVDLFMGAGARRFTPEMAAEVYGTFVADIREQSGMGRKNYAVRTGECPSEMYFEQLANYVALLELKRKGGESLNLEALNAELKNNLQGLKACGFTDERLMAEIKEADGFFMVEREGTSFDEEVAYRVKKYSKKFGGEANAEQESSQ